MVSLSLTPSMQKYFGNYATDFLNKKYGVDFNIEKLHFDYTGNIVINNLLIKNQQKDTLAYIGTLKTAIHHLTEYYTKHPYINDVSIKDIKLYMKTYKGKNTDELSYLIEQFDKEDTSRDPNLCYDPSFTMSIQNIHIENGHYIYQDDNIAPYEPLFNAQDINLEAQKLWIIGSSVSVELKNSNFTTHRGLKVKNFSCEFQHEKDKMIFNNTHIQTPYSQLKLDADFRYTNHNFNDFVNKVKTNVFFHKAIISSTDIKNYYKDIAPRHQFRFKNTKVNGVLNDLKFTDLYVVGMRHFSYFGDLNLKNTITNRENFKITGDFSQLTTTQKEIFRLLPFTKKLKTPKNLNLLGIINSIGNFTLDKNTLDVDVDIETNLGAASIFSRFKNFSNTKHLNYKGTVIANDFNLGRLVDRESIKSIDFHLDIEGSGVTLSDLFLITNGEIQQLTYKNYTYRNIYLKGILRDYFFDGHINANDPNMIFEFNGLADLSSTINRYDFQANIEKLNLKALHLIKKGKPPIIKGNVFMDITASNLDDAQGNIRLKNLSLQFPDKKYNFSDLNLKTKLNWKQIRNIQIESSDIISGNLEGKFKFANLSNLAIDAIKRIYTNSDENTKYEDDKYLDFDIHIKSELLSFLLPDLEISKNTHLKGNIDKESKGLELKFTSDKIAFKENSFENISGVIHKTKSNRTENSHLIIKKANCSGVEFKNFLLEKINLNENNFEIKANAFTGKDFKKNNLLYLTHYFNNIEQTSSIKINTLDFYVQDQLWKYHSTNKEKTVVDIYITHPKRHLSISPLTFRHQKQEVNFGGSLQENQFYDFKSSFKHINISSFAPQIEDFQYSGKLNGNLALRKDLKKGTQLSSDMTIEQINVNGYELGILHLNSTQNPKKNSTQYIKAYLHNGKEKTLSIEGNAIFKKALNNPIVDLSVSFDKFGLSCFSDLGDIVLSNLRGYVTGKAKLEGKIQNPNWLGELYLDQVGLTIPYLNIDYQFNKQSKITLQNQTFQFVDIDFLDSKYKTKGILSGSITHKAFKKWNLDLKVTAKEKLLALDVTDHAEALYFGTAFIEGKANIKGPTSGLTIDVIAKSKEDTVFKIPLRDTAALSDKDYIHFLTKEEKYQSLNGQDIKLKDVSGLDVNFDLQITPDADVAVIIDPETQSELNTKGEGHLIIELNTNGKFYMWGDFVTHVGKYNFKYKELIEKIFFIKKGGRITWQGNPWTAELQLRALYNTQANPSILLEDQTFSRKIPVEVLIDLSGSLQKPKLGFDLNFPNSSPLLISELDYVLSDRSIKELQALSLITQGIFHNSETAGQNVVTGNLIEKASSLINSVFSSENDKFKVGLSYALGQRYLDLETEDKVGLTFSSNLSKRILLNGKFGMPIGGALNNNYFSGEFNLSYLINKKGNFRGNVFSRESDIQFTGEPNRYTHGIGLSYGISFNSFSELLEQVFNKKPRNKDKNLKNKYLNKTRDSLQLEKLNTKDLIEFKNNNFEKRQP